MKISYQYKIRKTAGIFDGKTWVPVGEFEQDTREGDTCKLTVRLFKNIPKELMDLITSTPQLLSMKEIKMQPDTIVVVPEAHDGGSIII